MQPSLWQLIFQSGAGLLRSEMELRRGRWQAGSHRAHDEVVGSGSHSLVVGV
jgi:hypothetical protein